MLRTRPGGHQERSPGIGRERPEEGKVGEGREGGKAEKRKGLKESLFSLSGDSSAPKKETKEGRKGGGFGREEEEKG